MKFDRDRGVGRRIASCTRGNDKIDRRFPSPASFCGIEGDLEEFEGSIRVILVRPRTGEAGIGNNRALICRAVLIQIR